MRYQGRPLGTDTFLVRQRLWRECCASTEEHRFDCKAVPPEQRGPGPFGPVKP